MNADIRPPGFHSSYGAMTVVCPPFSSFGSGKPRVVILGLSHQYMCEYIVRVEGRYHKPLVFISREKRYSRGHTQKTKP